MATTYEAIAKSIATGSSTTVTFSSIPSTYTDLLISYSARNANDTIYMFFNGQTAPQTTYSNTRVYGNGATATSARDTSTNGFVRYGINYTSATANTFCNTEIYIPNYAGSSNKCFTISTVTEDNLASTGYANVNAQASLWSNTAAITSISFIGIGGNLVAGSSFYLYGIKNS